MRRRLCYNVGAAISLRIFYRRMTMTENEVQTRSMLDARIEDECKRLVEWMKLTGFTADELAQYITMRPNSLRVQLHRGRLTDAFRWRFGRAFPKGVASTLLLKPEDFPVDSDDVEDVTRGVELQAA
jgi:hypothetical protein